MGQLGEFRRALHELQLSHFDLGSRGAPAEIAHSLGAKDIAQAQRAEPDQHSWLPNVVELPPCRAANSKLKRMNRGPDRCPSADEALP